MSDIEPNHYAYATIDWNIVADDWHLPHRLCHVLKYLCRYQRKGTPIQDLQKAKQYIEYQISVLQANER